jgi:hypothetical protein
MGFTLFDLLSIKLDLGCFPPLRPLYRRRAGGYISSSVLSSPSSLAGFVFLSIRLNLSFRLLVVPFGLRSAVPQLIYPLILPDNDLSQGIHHSTVLPLRDQGFPT